MQKMCNILIKLNCKRSYPVYLIECTLCKREYIDKSETIFNLRSKNRQKDLHEINSIEADHNFRQTGHNFNLDENFVLQEQLNINM